MGDFRTRLTGALRVYLVLLCILIGSALCTGPGKCPMYPTLPNFDIHRMSGIWYEVERSFYLMEISTRCTAIDVLVNERGSMHITVNTVNRCEKVLASVRKLPESIKIDLLRTVNVCQYKRTSSPIQSHGIGIPSSTGSSMFRYKINNRMPYVLGRMLPGAGQYNVLFTDYDNFAIIWSCTSVSIAHSDRMWVLARRREISAPLRAQIYTIMEELHLDTDRLILAKNHNCSAV